MKSEASLSLSGRHPLCLENMILKYLSFILPSLILSIRHLLSFVSERFNHGKCFCWTVLDYAPLDPMNPHFPTCTTQLMQIRICNFNNTYLASSLVASHHNTTICTNLMAKAVLAPLALLMNAQCPFPYGVTAQTIFANPLVKAVLTPLAL